MAFIKRPRAPKDKWLQVSVFGLHTVALRTDGTVRAWGYNSSGQCNIPTDLGPCAAISGGASYTIALRTDGSVRAWGRNDYGQCDIPTDLGPCTAIACGFFHTIALRTDGSVRTWGDNSFGQCNIPTDLGPCTAVAAGEHHTVALLEDGTVRAWGSLYLNFEIPWELSDSGWYDFIANYDSDVKLTDVVPVRIRRTEKYRNIRLMTAMS